jgi:2,3,4,5-tetrahydropyridine-2,6-dicarboxylate N-succinyltransferase (EC 2.3.1.117)
MNTLEAIITQAWEEQTALTPQSKGPFRDAIQEAIELLGSGKYRIAEKQGAHWHVNVWLKQAVLLYFRLHANMVLEGQGRAFDKVPLKFDGWDEDTFKAAGFRVVPGAVVRTGSYLAPQVIIMPSFVNIGAYVDAGTMIDSYATVGSCAQIGKNCHISSSAVIGGVLEPLQGTPVIIEDQCFIGAQAAVVEGALIEEGAVIAMGTTIGISTPVIDRETGETFYGRVPPYSVVVPGTLPAKDTKIAVNTGCAVIVKRVTPETRAKTAINELLRA